MAHLLPFTLTYPGTKMNVIFLVQDFNTSSSHSCSLSQTVEEWTSKHGNRTQRGWKYKNMDRLTVGARHKQQWSYQIKTLTQPGQSCPQNTRKLQHIETSQWTQTAVKLSHKDTHPTRTKLSTEHQEVTTQVNRHKPAIWSQNRGDATLLSLPQFYHSVVVHYLADAFLCYLSQP